MKLLIRSIAVIGFICSTTFVQAQTDSSRSSTPSNPQKQKELQRSVAPNPVLNKENTDQHKIDVRQQQNGVRSDTGGNNYRNRSIEIDRMNPPFPPADSARRNRSHTKDTIY